MSSKAYEMCNIYLVPWEAFFVYFQFLIITWVPEIAGYIWVVSALQIAGP